MKCTQQIMPRKHVPQNSYISYLQQFPLFAELDSVEANDFQAAPDNFPANHPETLLFPEPLLRGRKLPDAAAVAGTRIVAGNSRLLQQTARDLAALLCETCGAAPVLVDDADPRIRLESAYPLVILGGSHENRCSLEMARRYQLGLFCANFPGEGGWGMTTIREPEAGMPPRFLLAFDEFTAGAAIEAFVQQAPDPVKPGNWGWVHEVHPAPNHPVRACGLQDCIGAGEIPQWFPLLRGWAAGEDPSPYSEVFLDFFVGLEREYPDACAGKPCGLPYSAVALDIGIRAIRYYQATGCREALQLFRQTLLGYWLYLNTENPTIYVSDMDFRLGKLCVYWSWVEHSPAITEQERETVPALLLALTRMVRDYYRNLWKKGEAVGAGRKSAHNHQTFKCSSLAQAWRYFGRWNLPDRASWKEEADALFAPLDPAAFKHTENAGNYETFIPEHTLVWMENTGVAVPPAMREALSLFAWREWVTRDNFLQAVDYGDNDPGMATSRPMEIYAWIRDDSEAERRVGELEKNCGDIFPWQLPASVRNFSGLSAASPRQPFAGQSGWQIMPLDPGFGGGLALAGSHATRFDKLVWRSGWRPESAYIAIEGVGNQVVSHAHNEANGILRINFGGRIWAVRNGYGKRAGIADAGQSFSTRQRGPEEHNMLVVRDSEGQAAAPPPNAQLVHYATAPFPCSVTLLAGYAGINWIRMVVALRGAGFLILDQVIPADGCERLPVVELQWNLLGCLEQSPDGGTSLLQNGCQAEFCHFGSAVTDWRDSPVEVWRRLIESRAYPHTSCMPKHLIMHRNQGVQTAGEYLFITGLWSRGAARNPDWDRDKAQISLQLADAPPDFQTDHPWAALQCRNGTLVVKPHLTSLKLPEEMNYCDKTRI